MDIGFDNVLKFEKCPGLSGLVETLIVAQIIQAPKADLLVYSVNYMASPKWGATVHDGCKVSATNFGQNAGVCPVGAGPNTNIMVPHS